MAYKNVCVVSHSSNVMIDCIISIPTTLCKYKHTRRDVLREREQIVRFAPHKKGDNHSVEESSIPRKHLSELSEKIAKRNFFLGSSFEER